MLLQTAKVNLNLLNHPYLAVLGNGNFGMKTLNHPIFLRESKARENQKYKRKQK